MSLTIALTKGRLQKQTLALFEKAGIEVSFVDESNRKLTFTSPAGELTFLLVKAADVTTYVRHGVADLGVVGKDVLIEHPGEYYELLDLGIGRCKFSVASTAGFELKDYKRKMIATKYPTVARQHFQKKGEDVEIIRIEGSVEIAPILGLADAIVDIVETGTTLRENGLQVYEDIMEISARMIANRAALKRKRTEISQLLATISQEIKENAL